jgi:hypothetical protein
MTTASFSRLALLLSICLGLTGCGFWAALFPQGPESEAIPLVKSEAPWLKRLDDSSTVYRLLEPKTEPQVFLTSIRTCESKKASPETSLRRLLVGLRKVRILEPRSVSVRGSAASASLVYAELDGSQLELQLLSLTQHDCLLDLILWTQSPRPESTALEPFLAFLLTRLDAEGGELAVTSFHD